MDFHENLAKQLFVRAINVNSSGDNTILAATAGLGWEVWDFFLQAEAAVAVTIESGTTALTGPINFAMDAEKRFTGDIAPVWTSAAVNEAFIVNLSGAVQVNGWALMARKVHQL